MENNEKYLSLAPDETYTPYAYFKAVDYALEDDTIKNIALSGPYGSGKSSIIKSYINKHQKSNKFLQISMATFTDTVNKDNNIDTNDNIIEIMESYILKQFLYKISPTKLPQSRYKRIIKFNFPIRYLLVGIFFILCYILAKHLFPDTLLFIETNFNSLSYLEKSITLFSALIILLMIIYAVVYMWRFILNRIYIKTIHLPVSTSIETGIAPSDSIFNKNLDELIYLFQTTKYNVIVFKI